MLDRVPILCRIFFLYSFFVLLNDRCLSTEARNDTDPPELSFSLRKPSSEADLEFLENTTSSHLRWRRLVNLAADKRKHVSGVRSEERNNEKCVGPDGWLGHCEYLVRCFNEKYYSDFTLAANYTCTIDRAYLGVCCTNHVHGVRTNVFGDEKNLATILPAVAVDDRTGTGEENGEEFTKEDSDEGKRTPRRSRGCGTTLVSKTRLVGGRPADPTEWPWMAALLRQGITQYCGGVLITDRHILTAGHCVYRVRPRDLTVRLGEYDFTKSDETRALDFAVSEIRIHEDFSFTSYENDIAIVKIHRPTVFNSYIWPVCLPPIDQTFENKNGIVTGWGTQYYGGPASTVLMEVSVPIWPQDKCVNSFNQYIPRTTMCAGGYEGGRDACQGDSGGPLLHQLGNGRWVNIGIVSWGIKCGVPGNPGIYTRVNSYLDWIFANAIF